MTRDISDQYAAWARGGRAAAFSPDSPFGGDALAVRSGRIHQGRWELNEAVERQLAATGGDDYDEALTVVLSQCRSGVLCLSQQALEGTGIRATRAGRNGLVHDAQTGQVVALAGAPTSVPLGQPPVAEERSARFADAAAHCATRRPSATAEDHRLSTQRLVERCDPATAREQISGWIQAGGAAVAGIRFG